VSCSTHRPLDAFFSKLPGFLKMMPDFRPKWVVDEIRSRAGCFIPGVRSKGCARGGPSPFEAAADHLESPLGIRQKPQRLFSGVGRNGKPGSRFPFGPSGREFSKRPKEFTTPESDTAKNCRLRLRAVKVVYERWLKEGTVVVSTARQENFGISMVEAISAGCIPLLPRRLVLSRDYSRNLSRRFSLRPSGNWLKSWPESFPGLPVLQEKWKETLSGNETFSWHSLIKNMMTGNWKTCVLLQHGPKIKD
jgi:hypothetical protein